MGAGKCCVSIGMGYQVLVGRATVLSDILSFHIYTQWLVLSYTKCHSGDCDWHQVHSSILFLSAGVMLSLFFCWRGDLTCVRSRNSTGTTQSGLVIHVVTASVLLKSELQTYLWSWVATSTKAVRSCVRMQCVFIVIKWTRFSTKKGSGEHMERGRGLYCDGTEWAACFLVIACLRSPSSRTRMTSNLWGGGLFHSGNFCVQIRNQAFTKFYKSIAQRILLWAGWSGL